MSIHFMEDFTEGSWLVQELWWNHWYSYMYYIISIIFTLWGSLINGNTKINKDTTSLNQGWGDKTHNCLTPRSHFVGYQLSVTKNMKRII